MPCSNCVLNENCSECFILYLEAEIDRLRKKVAKLEATCGHPNRVLDWSLDSDHPEEHFHCPDCGFGS